MTPHHQRPADPSAWWRLGEQHARARTALKRLRHLRGDPDAHATAEGLAAEAADVLASVADRAEAAHPVAREATRIRESLPDLDAAVAELRARRASGGTS